MKRNRSLPFLFTLVLPFCSLSYAANGSQSAKAVVVDARAPQAPPEMLPFPVGGTSPGGHTLSANNRYLVRDGQPWFPIMGEFHYARYPAERWEQEILKMKAGGIQVIATYIFWIYHEEVEGEFDWAGQRDLRRFVELCARHGLYVWIRIGPWDHGEVRNGGFPDWILQKCPTRQNDPIYLKYVAGFYGQIGQQLNGLFWKDNGPIIGVQLENEYSARGPGKGEEHILRLRELARGAGLDAPFYSVTAWDGAAIPKNDVLPVFSGYADGFWWRSLDELPPNSNFFFTKIRCQENVDERLNSKHPDIDELDSHYPFLTAEMGGGMELAYHRRPLLTADDTASMELVKLGSGVTLYGYYMFHGGTNPEGRLTDLQESQATGSPNDLPVRSYDYQAPIGEFGQEGDLFNVLKLFHLFLRDFGAQLAPMMPYFPAHQPTGIRDTSTTRVAVRVLGDRGFLFINNYERNYPLPTRENFQVQLKLPGETITVPHAPIEIPTGSYMIWPLNMDLGTGVLRYATTQLLCRLAEQRLYVFFSEPGIPAEFAFKQRGGKIEATGARIRRIKGITYVDGIETGTRVAIKLRNGRGEETKIIVLSRDQAAHAWKATLTDKERLILSQAQLYADEHKLVFTSASPELKVEVFPPFEKTPDGFTQQRGDGIFTEYESDVQPLMVKAKADKLSNPGDDPPLKMGKEVVLAPEESTFDSAARWAIHLPEITQPDVSNIWLRIAYQGDVARIYANGRLVTDNFYNGSSWILGLNLLSTGARVDSVELRILPLQDRAPIYLPHGAWPAIPAGGRIAELKSVDFVPEYSVVMNVAP